MKTKYNHTRFQSPDLDNADFDSIIFIQINEHKHIHIQYLTMVYAKFETLKTSMFNFLPVKSK